jgi:hypothetical protein
MTPLKNNNSIVTNTNDVKVDEISKTNDYKYGQHN